MKTHRRSRTSRLARIERKCDRILSELLVMRKRAYRRDALDDAIDKLHVQARRMRELSRMERDAMLEMSDKNED